MLTNLSVNDSVSFASLQNIMLKAFGQPVRSPIKFLIMYLSYSVPTAVIISLSTGLIVPLAEISIELLIACLSGAIAFLFMMFFSYVVAGSMHLSNNISRGN